MLHIFNSIRMFANRYSYFWTLTMCHNIISVSASYYSSPSAGTFWIDLCKQISKLKPKPDTEHKPYPNSRPNKAPVHYLCLNYLSLYLSVKYLTTSWSKFFLIFSLIDQLHTFSQLLKHSLSQILYISFLLFSTTIFQLLYRILFAPLLQVLVGSDNNWYLTT